MRTSPLTLRYSLSPSSAGTDTPASSAASSRAAPARAILSISALRVAGSMPVLRRLAQDFGAIAVRQDEAALLRKDLGRHLGMGGEEEAVGMQPVVRPFAVDAKILDRGFDLDDPDVALPGQRDEVGAPAGRQRQFRQHMRAHLGQQPLHAAADDHGALGLAAVERAGSGESVKRWAWLTMPAFVHGLNPPMRGDCIFPVA